MISNPFLAEISNQTWFDRFESEITLFTQGTTKLWDVMAVWSLYLSLWLKYTLHIYPVTCLGFSWQKWHFFFYFKKPNTASGCTWMTLITNYRCEGRREPQIVCYKEGFCCGALSQIHAGPTPVRTLRLFFSHCCQKANSSRITRPGLGSDCKSDLPCISLSLPPA